MSKNTSQHLPTIANSPERSSVHYTLFTVLSCSTQLSDSSISFADSYPLSKGGNTGCKKLWRHPQPEAVSENDVSSLGSSHLGIGSISHRLAALSAKLPADPGTVELFQYTDDPKRAPGDFENAGRSPGGDDARALLVAVRVWDATAMRWNNDSGQFNGMVSKDSWTRTNSGDQETFLLFKLKKNYIYL